MADLKINLLGPPEILWDNQPLNINRRTPRTILYFLASQNKFVGRGKLISFFWQDSSESFGRRRLRVALSRIRSEIPDTEIISIQNDLVGLNSSNLSVDLRNFNDLQQRVGTKPWSINPNQPLPDEIISPMLNAVNLWRGSQFLEGIELPTSAPLENWWSQINHELVQEHTHLLTRISEHFYAAGQFEKALSFAKCALEIDHLNEETHYQVLNLMVELDRIHEALQHYSKVTKILQEELDAQPSQQLVSIYRQIQRKSQGSSLPIRPDWRLLTTIDTPFVGREKEFRELNDAKSSRGGVLVSGESGLGKTRLIQEFCESQGNSSRILSTHCLPAEYNLPFQPLIEILRKYITPSEWENLPDAWIRPLAMLLPEISRANKSQESQEPGLYSDQNRSILFEAIRQIFLQISRDNQLILFIDDLQWSDEATLSTIAYLIERSPFTDQALLIMAARPDENPGSIEEMLCNKRSTSNLGVISLQRLNRVEISVLGRYVMGYPLEQDFVDQLSNETGGNPFIILETLRSFQGKEKLATFSSSQLPLTKSVFNLIQNRLRKLSPGARKICEYAAVIGTEFDPLIISIASEQNLSIIARALEELKQRQIVETVERADRPAQWRFIHDKIRETIILDTNQVQLRFVHEHIAWAIETNHKGNIGSQAAILARHYEYSGSSSTAVKYWIEAARWARKLYSNQEALQICSHAESLILQNQGSINERLIQDLYNEWTELAYEIQDAELIRELNSRLLELGRSTHNMLLIGTALDGLGDACLVEDQFEKGLMYSNQAISYLEQTNNVFETINSYTHRGVYLFMLGRLNEAVRSFEQAIALGSENDDPSVRRGIADAYYQLALSITLAGWPELGLKYANTSLDLAQKIEHHHITATALLAKSLAQYFIGDYQNARQTNKRGVEIAERMHANRVLGYLLTIRTFLETASGDLKAAYNTAQWVLDLGLEDHHQDLQSLAHRIIGDIFLLLDSHENARKEFKLGFELGGTGFWGLENLVRLGYSQIMTGHTDIGMTNLQRGIEQAHSAGFVLVELRGMQFQSYAYASNGQWDLTRQVSKDLIRKARIRNLSIESLLAKFIGELAEINQSNPQENIEHLEYLADYLGDKQHPYIALRILTQIVILKRLIQSDPTKEINKITKILKRCEEMASPGDIQASFLEYTQKIESLIIH